LTDKNYVGVGNGSQYDNIYDDYIEARNIVVQNRYVSYDNLTELNTVHVNNIYIYDDLYMYKFIIDYDDYLYNRNERTDFTPYIFSIPNFIYNNYLDYSPYVNLGVNFLNMGTYPNDYVNEIVLSRKLLKKYYGYSDSDVETSLNKTINLKNIFNNIDQEYTVVGFCNLDMILISYNGSDEYGIYHYDEDTYDDFCKKQKNIMLELFEMEYDFIEYAFLEIDPNFNTEITKDTFSKFGYSMIYSYDMDHVLMIKHLLEVIPLLIIMNLFLVLLLSVPVYSTTRDTIKIDSSYIIDIGNYYLNRSGMFKRYIWIKVILYALAFVIFIPIACIYINSPAILIFYVCLITLIDYILILLPSIINVYKKYMEIKV